MASVLATGLGEGARDIALGPWVLLAFVAGIDLLLSRRGRVRLEPQLADEIFVGETATLRLSMPNAPMGVQARLDWPKGLTGPSEMTFAASSDGIAGCEIPCRAAQRGVWDIGQIWLFWRSRLGLFDYVPRVELGLSVKVVPNIRLVQSGEIAAKVQSALFGVKENRAIGEGTEFHQLREFVQGMDVKTIDWKRSAKQRSLVARELQAERNHHVIIALDNGYLMSQQVDGLPRIDHAVTSALAVAWAAVIGGDQIGYYSYDVRPRSFVAPSQGRQAFARMRSWTGELDYVGHQSNHTLALTELNSLTPKRSLLIIFTDFVDTTSAELLVENATILSKRHLLIFVTIRDPALEALVSTAPDDLDGVAAVVSANQSLNERRLVLEKLARLGVTVLDAKPNTLSAQLLSAYLDIKAREMI